MLTEAMEVRRDIVNNFVDKVSHLQLPDAGEIGGMLLALGVVLLIGFELHRWVKRKGYRMVLKDRNQKIHALLLEILCDGLEKAEADEAISHQEKLRTYEMLRRKLGLLDLVPKKHIASEVKARLKSARLLREKQRADGTEHHPKLPDETKIVVPAKAVTGNANRWWRKAS